MSTVATDSKMQPWDDQRLALIASWRRNNPGKLPTLNRSDRTEAHICQWLAAQNRRGDLITQSEIILLNSIFPDWRRVRIDTFSIYLYETCVFVDRSGRLPSAKSNDTSERRLGEWVARKASRAKDGTLLLSEIRSLNGAIPGWRDAIRGEGRVAPMPKRSAARPKPDRTPHASWDDRMSQMESFYRESHRPPLRMKPDEQVLANWLMAQQTGISEGTLSVDRTHRLMKLLTDDPTISFRPNSDEFDLWLESLRASYADSGITHMNYPSDGGALLWEWLETMNFFYYRGELSDDQVSALDAVDTTWRERRRG